MKLELYFAPGACSFVPHAGLEAVKAATGQAFEPKLVKLHKGEQREPAYLALNPDAQVPVLVVDGKPLTQIVVLIECQRHAPRPQLAVQFAEAPRLGRLPAHHAQPHGRARARLHADA